MIAVTGRLQTKSANDRQFLRSAPAADSGRSNHFAFGVK
jgi:hypothetical protein